MSAALTTGIFTLFGVLVGGLLNVVTTARADERRGRRALRTTARVVGTELVTNEAILTAIAEGTWPRADDRVFNFNAWEHYRHVLAERLPQDDWLLLQDAVRRLHVFERKITSEAAGAMIGLTAEQREVAETAVPAREMLARHS